MSFQDVLLRDCTTHFGPATLQYVSSCSGNGSNMYEHFKDLTIRLDDAYQVKTFDEYAKVQKHNLIMGDQQNSGRLAGPAGWSSQLARTGLCTCTAALSQTPFDSLRDLGGLSRKSIHSWKASWTFGHAQKLSRNVGTFPGPFGGIWGPSRKLRGCRGPLGSLQGLLGTSRELSAAEIGSAIRNFDTNALLNALDRGHLHGLKRFCQ